LSRVSSGGIIEVVASLIQLRGSIEQMFGGPRDMSSATKGARRRSQRRTKRPRRKPSVRTIAMTIEELWEQHLQAGFRAECRARDVDGIDVVMLDADIAGCVDTFLSRKRPLDPWRIAILGARYRDARYVLAHLEPQARQYFERLERLAGAVLHEVITATRASSAGRRNKRMQAKRGVL